MAGPGSLNTAPFPPTHNIDKYGSPRGSDMPASSMEIDACAVAGNTYRHAVAASAPSVASSQKAPLPSGSPMLDISSFRVTPTPQEAAAVAAKAMRTYLERVAGTESENPLHVWHDKHESMFAGKHEPALKPEHIVVEDNMDSDDAVGSEMEIEVTPQPTTTSSTPASSVRPGATTNKVVHPFLAPPPVARAPPVTVVPRMLPTDNLDLPMAIAPRLVPHLVPQTAPRGNNNNIHTQMRPSVARPPRAGVNSTYHEQMEPRLTESRPAHSWAPPIGTLLAPPRPPATATTRKHALSPSPEDVAPLAKRPRTETGSERVRKLRKNRWIEERVERLIQAPSLRRPPELQPQSEGAQNNQWIEERVEVLDKVVQPYGPQRDESGNSRGNSRSLGPRSSLAMQCVLVNQRCLYTTVYESLFKAHLKYSHNTVISPESWPRIVKEAQRLFARTIKEGANSLVPNEQSRWNATASEALTFTTSTTATDDLRQPIPLQNNLKRSQMINAIPSPALDIQGREAIVVPALLLRPPPWKRKATSKNSATVSIGPGLVIGTTNIIPRSTVPAASETLSDGIPAVAPLHNPPWKGKAVGREPSAAQANANRVTSTSSQKSFRVPPSRDASMTGSDPARQHFMQRSSHKRYRCAEGGCDFTSDSPRSLLTHYHTTDHELFCASDHWESVLALRSQRIGGLVRYFTVDGRGCFKTVTPPALSSMNSLQVTSGAIREAENWYHDLVAEKRRGELPVSVAGMIHRMNSRIYENAGVAPIVSITSHTWHDYSKNRFPTASGEEELERAVTQSDDGQESGSESTSIDEGGDDGSDYAYGAGHAPVEWMDHDYQEPEGVVLQAPERETQPEPEREREREPEHEPEPEPEREAEREPEREPEPVPALAETIDESPLVVEASAESVVVREKGHRSEREVRVETASNATNDNALGEAVEPMDYDQPTHEQEREAAPTVTNVETRDVEMVVAGPEPLHMNDHVPDGGQTDAVLSEAAEHIGEGDLVEQSTTTTTTTTTAAAAAAAAAVTAVVVDSGPVTVVVVRQLVLPVAGAPRRAAAVVAPDIVIPEEDMPEVVIEYEEPAPPAPAAPSFESRHAAEDALESVSEPATEDLAEAALVELEADEEEARLKPVFVEILLQVVDDIAD